MVGRFRHGDELIDINDTIHCKEGAHMDKSIFDNKVKEAIKTEVAIVYVMVWIGEVSYGI